MDSIKILKDHEVLSEISMDTLKGGAELDSSECCKVNNACNVNSGVDEPVELE